MSEAASGTDALAKMDRTRATIADGRLIGPVLSRIVGIHASRADLPLDRVNDAVLIADALAARAPGLIEGNRLPTSVQSAPGRLEIRLGPLSRAVAVRVLEGAALPEIGPVIERLADSVSVRPGSGGGEYLVVRVGTGAPT